MKVLTSLIAVIVSGTVLVAAEDHLIGHWDFADAKGNAVPGKAGPAGNIKRLECAEIVQRAGKTLLKMTGDAKKRNIFACFIVNKMPLDPTKPFTVLCDLYFDEELPPRGTNEIFSMSDGEKLQGFRVFYFWGKIILRTGDGKVLQQLSSAAKARDFRMPAGRLIQIGATYDGKTAALFADGKMIAEKEFKILPCKNRNMCFGSEWFGSAYPLNGALGNIRVYDKALSSQEIAEKYLAEREAQE